MNDADMVSIAQLEAFLKGVDGAITFSLDTKGYANKQKMYDWIGLAMSRFAYWRVSKKERGIILSYIQKVTGLSRIQIKRLVRRKKSLGRLRVKTEGRNSFPIWYAPADIALLVETDNAHGRISGNATKRIMEREYQVFKKLEYERISCVSVSHLYNIRSTSRQYQSHSLHIAKTKAVQRDIGIRKKPNAYGKPGYLRVDTVHQGDLDKEKGVYHINLVDEVTQWEIIGCVRGISEQFLAPLLIELLERFPFVILGFHSDNGGEYINQIVARLLNKLMIEQTKSRSRRTNDNALVEGKNGSRIRKHMGYIHIPRHHAQVINQFYREHMGVYLNYHRPCGFATEKIDEKGKIKKVYDLYRIPYEALRSHLNASEFLKEGVSFEILDKIAYQKSDNECAALMQKAKIKLFKNIMR